MTYKSASYIFSCVMLLSVTVLARDKEEGPHPLSLSAPVKVRVVCNSQLINVSELWLPKGFFNTEHRKPAIVKYGSDWLWATPLLGYSSIPQDRPIVFMTALDKGVDPVGDGLFDGYTKVTFKIDMPPMKDMPPKPEEVFVEASDGSLVPSSPGMFHSYEDKDFILPRSEKYKQDEKGNIYRTMQLTVTVCEIVMSGEDHRAILERKRQCAIEKAEKDRLAALEWQEQRARDIAECELLDPTQRHIKVCVSPEGMGPLDQIMVDPRFLLSDDRRLYVLKNKGHLGAVKIGDRWYGLQYVLYNNNHEAFMIDVSPLNSLNSPIEDCHYYPVTFELCSVCRT